MYARFKTKKQERPHRETVPVFYQMLPDFPEK